MSFYSDPKYLSFYSDPKYPKYHITGISARVNGLLW